MTRRNDETLVTQDYLDLFIEESKEHIHLLNELIVELERCPADMSIINDMFRSVHTLKGMAQTMGYQELSSLTHQIENILEATRKGQLNLTNRKMDLIFNAIDLLGGIIYNIVSDRENKVQAIGLVKKLEQIEREEALIDEKNDESDQTFLTPEKKQRLISQKKIVRIETKHFVEWFDLYYELQASYGDVMRISSGIDHADLKESIDQIDKVKEQIEDLTQKIRWVPVDHIFRRFRPMIQKLAKELNKKVRIKIPKVNVKVDRVIIDDIVDILVHFTRNAVDHGIEAPDVRIAKDKRETGTLTLSAYQNNSHLFIEVADDGAGIDQEKIMNHAISKQFITNEEAEQLTSDDVYQLMVEAGFSTRNQLTDISGRGIGLDVAKNTIELLGGKLSIDSTINSGSAFIIKLPLKGGD